MPKKTTLADMQEHLFEMAERLLDEEVTDKNPEALQREIDKANALVEISAQVVSIKEVENRQKEVNVKAMQTAHDCGLLYKPAEMQFEDLPMPGKNLQAKKSSAKLGPYGEYED